MCVFVTGYTRLETKFPLRFFISESRNSGYGEDFRLFQPRSFFFKNDGVSGGKFLQASALCLDANELNAFIFRCMNGAMSVGTNHKPVTCFDINDLAVNEQNPLAKGFYEHLGFIVYKRTEFDEQGNAYPLLYMKRS